MTQDRGMSEPTQPSSQTNSRDDVVVFGSDADAEADSGSEQEDSPRSVTDLVEQPAKVMRIGTMVKQLLDEVKAAPLDEASRKRLGEIHRSTIAELKEGLAPELLEELERLALPFQQEHTPSDAELRVVHAQLVGWLEGLFHGIQTTLFAQQMASRNQLEQLRRGLPPGQGGPQVPGQQEQSSPGSGMYL